MNILAYDTSSETLSMALFRDNKSLGELDLPLFTRNSSTLAPSLDILLRSHNLPVKKIDYIAVGLGPGSFTGLRVGITTAKVMAYSLRKKIVGVPSMQAMASCVASWQGSLAVVLDAKKEKVYAAFYEMKNRGCKPIGTPILTDIRTLLKTIKKRTLFVGSGALLYREKIESFPKALFE